MGKFMSTMRFKSELTNLLFSIEFSWYGVFESRRVFNGVSDFIKVDLIGVFGSSFVGDRSTSYTVLPTGLPRTLFDS
jgi:hypothetical protein